MGPTQPHSSPSLLETPPSIKRECEEGTLCELAWANVSGRGCPGGV